MPNAPIDQIAAHRFFSAYCFNAAWELIEKHARTDEDNRQMHLLAQASLWHWTQRVDCLPKNIATGYWQIARIYALLGEAENARNAGELCLQYSVNESPFMLGYAHEALARAAKIAGDEAAKLQHINEAKQFAAQILDLEYRKLLEGDLAGLE